jgi:hypothetical protein
VNNEHKSLSWFRPLLGGNSPMSNGLILMKTSVIKGEQSARVVHMLKGSGSHVPLPEG